MFIAADTEPSGGPAGRPERGGLGPATRKGRAGRDAR